MVTQIGFGHRNLLKDVRKPFRIAHEVAAGHLRAVQHAGKALPLRPFVDDIRHAEIQLTRLREQLALARRRGLPVVLHCVRTFEELMDEASKALLMLEKDIDEATHVKGMQLALFAKSSLVEDMRKLRAPLDALELIVDKSYWPIPSYGDLLFHTI